MSMLDLFERYATTFAKRGSRLRDTMQELGVMLEPVLEPVVLGCEPDQHSGRPTVPRNDDFLLSRQP